MKKFTCLLVLILLILQASAQWSTNPAVNNAISDLSGEQVLSKIGLCSDGNIYIAFLSNVSGSYNVRLQKLDSQGNELWAHNGILISDHPTDSWTSDWDMTVDISDHAILTFSDTRAGGNWDTYAYRISPSGAFVWGADGIALSNNSAFNAAPKVTCTAAGNAVFAWGEENTNIIMQKITPAGVKMWGDNGIILSSVNSLTWPQLMPVGTDDIILKYFDDEGNPPYPTRHVFAQRYNSAGTAVWSSPAVISDAGGISSWTQIFSFINDGSDGFYIAWHDDRDNNQLSSAFIQHVNSSGQPEWTANGVEISTLGGRNHFYPYLSLPPGSTDVYVFWNEMSGDQNQRGIYAQKISSSGARVWGTSGITLIALAYNPVLPIAASASLTDNMLLYSDGMTGSEQLKAMRIATDGSFVWNPSSVTLSSAPSSKVHPVMSDFANDQWVASWDDDRNDANDIYAQNVSIAGTLGPYEIVYGTIQGNVSLDGGTGNVTQVVVTAGVNSTYPDPTGDYILEVQTGTYTVTATLAGYYPGEVPGVVVLENQSTNNVDFTLTPVPTMGWIEGNVELYEGNGDVTQTVITAGAVTTNPDANGDYSMEVGVGAWDVTATLEGYSPQMHSNVIVEPGLTTSNVDFLLTLIPTTGFLYGTVTIEGDMADVTLTEITSDTSIVTPDNQGDYLLELPVGSQFVQVTHPYTETDTVTVIIEPGGSTQQDFNLNMLRRDLIVTCHDQEDSPLNGSLIELTGPEGTYSGTMTEDSLIFEQVPFGLYAGMATFCENCMASADTIVDQTNDRLDFEIIIGTASDKTYGQLILSPNPVSAEGIISIKNAVLPNGQLSIYDSQGRKYAEIYIKPGNQQEFPVTLLFNNQKISEGIYYLHFTTENGVYSGKIVIKN